MHLEHRAGEYLEFDFAGDKLGFVDIETGEYPSKSVVLKLQCAKHLQFLGLQLSCVNLLLP